jgi:nicotinamide-nucleotide amidase
VNESASAPPSQPATHKLRIASLAIGDELLDGRVLDANTRDLGDGIAPMGLELCEARVIPDDRALIVATLRELVEHADIVVTSGGLGPTSDDVTAQCVAEAAGVGLRFDEPSYERMKAMFEGRGIPMPESNRRQAELPATSRTLENQMGTAPGFVTPFVLDGHHAAVWSFPGVPREYRHLLKDELLPHVKLRASGRRALVRRTLRSLGLAESAIGERLASFERAHPEVRVQYRAAFPEIIVRLVVEADDPAEIVARTDALALEAKEAIGDSVWSTGNDSLEERLCAVLKTRKQTLALAESCTGGLIGKRITDLPGSSAVFVGGVVSYANDVKAKLLGVSRTLLDTHGAVSEEVARAMAEGARTRLEATWALSVTGIAGPDGGSAEKPVGTVWFAIAGPDGVEARKKKLPDFGRERVREMAAAWGVRLLLQRMGAEG